MTCEAPECARPVRTRNARYCGMHYERLRRIGCLDLPERTQIRKTDGYVVVKRPGHPLAQGGWVYEHRAVILETQGLGPLPCYWCAKPLPWGRTLHVDHLDHDRGNNAPENLVVACLPCNSARKQTGDPTRWARIVAEREVLAQHAAEVDAVQRDLLRRLQGRVR